MTYKRKRVDDQDDVGITSPPPRFSPKRLARPKTRQTPVPIPNPQSASRLRHISQHAGTVANHTGQQRRRIQIPSSLPPSLKSVSHAVLPPASSAAIPTSPPKTRSGKQTNAVPITPVAPTPSQWPRLGTLGSIKGRHHTMGSVAVRPPDLVAPNISYHRTHTSPTKRHTPLLRPHGPSTQPPPKLKQSTIPFHVTPVSPPRPPVLPDRTSLKTPKPPGNPRATVPPLTSTTPRKSTTDLVPQRTDRNIDKVVLGKLCFRTWYPSYYGKELLGDGGGALPSKANSKESQQDAGGRSLKREKDQQHAMLERLYVCPVCFKYSKELVPWWGHVRLCEQRAVVPGEKIYAHPKGRRPATVPTHSQNGHVSKKRRGETTSQPVEPVVEDEGEWSIWKVDGEKDGLFCQNMSLFGKLFLDNKSVFFDVTGFNYFLIVYTPSANASVSVATSATVPQIVGFFSKEKMSWDNNNLACILVFPPWQRKGLGALLMGASYHISRREGVLGGPEKPISELGKKGYKRYWAGEIARWILSLDLSTDKQGRETIVTVEDCSQATWICTEDCLCVLRDMDLVQDAGLGPSKPPAAAGAGLGGDAAVKADHSTDGVKSDQEQQVPRVTLDKEAVRRYIADHRINLEEACDPNGFVGSYLAGSGGRSELQVT